jgi:hypothetical protein
MWGILTVDMGEIGFAGPNMTDSLEMLARGSLSFFPSSFRGARISLCPTYNHDNPGPLTTHHEKVKTDGYGSRRDVEERSDVRSVSIARVLVVPGPVRKIS